MEGRTSRQLRRTAAAQDLGIVDTNRVRPDGQTPLPADPDQLPHSPVKIRRKKLARFLNTPPKLLEGIDVQLTDHTVSGQKKN